MKQAAVVLFAVVACGHDTQQATGDAGIDAGADAAIDAPSSSLLGQVTGVTDATCPGAAPAGSTCKQITVTGCPGIETESIDAIAAILPATGTVKGTVVHFKGGGGEGFEVGGTAEYQSAGLRQVFISWLSDWEQTTASGIKTGGCRPSTVLKWVFDEPTLHAGSRTTGFCGEGFSGGSGQLGYALAFYGMGDYLDYVNEVSGPPFGRIDIGCNGDAPQSQTVCGAPVRTDLPPKVGTWENSTYCNQHDIPADELARWKADSVSVGGTYVYPQTTVRFFDCTSSNATAVTAMSTYYHDAMVAAGSDPSRESYRCYTASDGCSGEDLGPQGGAEAIAAMTAGCVANHR
jgi:hypothetical protein